MSDDADFSSEQEIFDNARALHEHRRSSSIEAPHIECGIKYCLDCGEEVTPKARAELKWVVRCLDCQEFLEKEQKTYA